MFQDQNFGSGRKPNTWDSNVIEYSGTSQTAIVRVSLPLVASSVSFNWQHKVVPDVRMKESVSMHVHAKNTP